MQPYHFIAILEQNITSFQVCFPLNISVLSRVDVFHSQEKEKNKMRHILVRYNHLLRFQFSLDIGSKRA